MKTCHSVLSAGIFLLLAGCTVGPNFERPSPPDAKAVVADPIERTEGTDSFGGTAQIFVSQGLPREWWRTYGCAPLDRLVDQALKSNPGLDAARASLVAAQEVAQAQRGVYWPQVSASYSPTRQKNSAVLSSALASSENPYSLHTAQVSISYVLDAFGGNRRQVEALEALAEVQLYELEAARQSVVGNVVLSAIQEASLRRQLEAATGIVAINEELAVIARRQLAAGELSQLGVATQEVAAAQARAQVPVLRKQLAQTRHLLMALTGALPNKDLDEQVDFSCLNLPQDLPTALPSRLVEQRPDVRAAEAQLHAASAQIGVAKASLLPQITLDASLGNVSAVLADLFKSGSNFWGVVGTASQTLFSGGTLAHRTAAAEAQYRQATAVYRGTVVTAFQNVADTLHAIKYDAEGLKAANDAERAAARLLLLARRQREAGEISQIAVLVAEQAWQQAALALVLAQANRFTDTAALFQALGGGWWQTGDGLVSDRNNDNHPN